MLPHYTTLITASNIPQWGWVHRHHHNQIQNIHSEDAIGEVLKAIIQFCGQWVHAWFNHVVYEKLELFFGKVHVKTFFQSLDRWYSFAETWQLWTCNTILGTFINAFWVLTDVCGMCGCMHNITAHTGATPLFLFKAMVKTTPYRLPVKCSCTEQA